LSYKWGCEQQVTTKTMNIGNFTNAINFNALPRTIQDAIIITRDLGIRYLWVDALCIIQDQEIDQSHEIESMGEIYKNSTITVAASNSRGVKDGFLKILKEPRAIKTKIRCERGLGTIWLLLESCMYESTEPLTSRAWAYQEKLLSTRILDYGSQSLIWSCPTESAKSIIPESILYFPDSRSFALERPGELSASRFSITKKDERAHLWRKIVESYSWRDAKFHRDRLLAIAGVARQIHELTGATYLAGIWKEAAIKQLCWRHCKEFVGEAQFLPRELNAPSWSWASVDGEVTFEEGLHNQEASLVGCTMELLRADAPFGNVARGPLTVAAKMVESNGDNHRFFRLYLDVRSTIPTLPITISENQGIQVSISGILRQAWYMLVGWTQLIRAPPPDIGPHWVERFPIGLILVRLERGEYMRIGFFKYSESRSSYDEIFGNVKPEDITVV
jgi:Heterokaryon incompatibility protein (HET)